MAALLSYAEFMGAARGGAAAPAGASPPVPPAQSGTISYADFMGGAGAQQAAPQAPATSVAPPVIGGVQMLPGGLDTGTAGTLDYGPQGSPSAQNFGAGLVRAARDVTDRPAEFLASHLGAAGEGDRIAQGDTATREQYEAGAGQTWAGTGGRLLGQLGLLAPIIASGAGLLGSGADALGAAVPTVAPLARAIAAIPGAGYAGGVARCCCRWRWPPLASRPGRATCPSVSRC